MVEKATPEIKAYFKKYIECINLEQNAETDRQNLYRSQSSKETQLRLVHVNQNGIDGTTVTLEKPLKGTNQNEF